MEAYLRLDSGRVVFEASRWPEIIIEGNYYNIPFGSEDFFYKQANNSKERVSGIQ